MAAHPHFVVKVFNTELHVTCACTLHVLASYMCLHIDRLLNVSLKERNMQSGDAQCELAPLKSETIKQVNKKQSLESTTFEYVCEWHKRPILIRMIPEGKGKLRMIPEGKGKLRMIPEGKGKLRMIPEGKGKLRMIPEGKGKLRMIPEGKGKLRMIPEGKGKLRMIPEGKGKLRMIPEGKGKLRMIPEGKGKLGMIPEGKGKLRMIPEGKGKFVPHNGSAICQIPTILHQH